MAVNCKSAINNQRGNAMIETLPLLVIFVVLLGFGIGFFGIVHTAIMNSMGARTYAFETFSNRSDLTYFRDRKAQDVILHHAHHENRFHTVNDDSLVNANADSGIYATTRELVFGRKIAAENNAKARPIDHNERIYELSGRNRRGGVEVSPAWIMVGYGICLNSSCGD